MKIKIIRILAILSLSVLFNVNCMEEISVNQKLINAAAKGNIEKVQDALKEGADINYKGSFKMNESLSELGSAVFLATRMGHLNIVKFLIDLGANTKIEYGYGEVRSLFEEAILNSQFKIAEYLLERKLGITSYDYNNLVNMDLVNMDALNFLMWHGIAHCKKADHKDIQHVINNLESNLTKIRAIPEDAFEDTLTEEEIKEYKANIKAGIIDIEEGIKVLKKFALKAENLENKSFKDMVKKVNQSKRARVKEANILISDLANVVVDYFLYPENIEEFFKISEEDLEELIKVYSEEFCYKEKDFGQDACSIM